MAQNDRMKRTQTRTQHRNEGTQAQKTDYNSTKRENKLFVKTSCTAVHTPIHLNDKNLAYTTVETTYAQN